MGAGGVGESGSAYHGSLEMPLKGALALIESPQMPSENTEQRKLAAIMFADMEGYIHAAAPGDHKVMSKQNDAEGAAASGGSP